MEGQSHVPEVVGLALLHPCLAGEARPQLARLLGSSRCATPHAASPFRTSRYLCQLLQPTVLCSTLVHDCSCGITGPIEGANQLVLHIWSKCHNFADGASRQQRRAVYAWARVPTSRGCMQAGVEAAAVAAEERDWRGSPPQSVA